MARKIKMYQMETFPDQNRKISITVVKACRKSTEPIMALRFHLSTNTPANGVKIIIGAKPTKDAIDKYRALFVSSVIHQIITNCAAEEPSRDTCWPKKKAR
jgi:hypothetical protein